MASADGCNQKKCPFFKKCFPKNAPCPECLKIMHTFSVFPILKTPNSFKKETQKAPIWGQKKDQQGTILVKKGRSKA